MPRGMHAPDPMYPPLTSWLAFVPRDKTYDNCHSVPVPLWHDAACPADSAANIRRIATRLRGVSYSNYNGIHRSINTIGRTATAIASLSVYRRQVSSGTIHPVDNTHTAVYRVPQNPNSAYCKITDIVNNASHFSNFSTIPTNNLVLHR